MVHTVLVTGAEGFAGGHLIQHLRGTGYEVVAGVRNRARKLALERQSQKAIVCDITDAINVARVIASVRPDAVVHLAGIAHPDAAGTDPLLAYQSIVTSWANLLDAVRRTVPRAKVVLASACDVYGPAGADGRPLREDTSPQPVSTFGSLKRLAESIAHTFFRDYHLNVTIARPFNYVGPGQSERSYFAAVARKLVDWGPGDGELRLPCLSCRRDLLHVDDVATAYERLVQDGRPNEIYNISSGQALTCAELVSAMAAEFGLQVPLTESPAVGLPPQLAALCGDNTKLREELHWSPTRSAQDGLRDLVASYRTAAAAVAR